MRVQGNLLSVPKKGSLPRREEQHFSSRERTLFLTGCKARLDGFPDPSGLPTNEHRYLRNPARHVYHNLSRISASKKAL